MFSPLLNEFTLFPRTLQNSEIVMDFVSFKFKLIVLYSLHIYITLANKKSFSLFWLSLSQTNTLNVTRESFVMISRWLLAELTKSPLFTATRSRLMRSDRERLMCMFPFRLHYTMQSSLTSPCPVCHDQSVVVLFVCLFFQVKKFPCSKLKEAQTCWWTQKVVVI